MEPQVRHAMGADSAGDLSRGILRPDPGSILTALASGAALVVSGISLWETSLKQPDLQVYLGSSLAYTRDPWASEEVFVVPMTITNSGARDGAVLSLQMDLRNTGSGTTDHFQSTYTVDSSYFGAVDDVTASRHRPKVPFAPIVVSGRTSYSGTLLFYPSSSHEKPGADLQAPVVARDKPVVDPKSSIEISIRVVTTKPSGWIDQVLATVPEPIFVRLDVPNFLPGALYAGELARLRPGAVGAKSP